jgi:hypothetical protein
VEQNGPESCELSPNSSFIMVRVPIRVEGQSQRSEATFHYGIGSFAGRETALTLGAGLMTILRFRIPRELFRARERLSVEIMGGSPAAAKKIIWVKRWEISWQGKTPALEPMTE